MNYGMKSLQHCSGRQFCDYDPNRRNIESINKQKRVNQTKIRFCMRNGNNNVGRTS